MLEWNHRISTLAAAMLLVFSTGAVRATEQAQQRRLGVMFVRRRVRVHDTPSRNVAADQKSNSQCRQEKRQTKQHGRQTARDIKY